MNEKAENMLAKVFVDANILLDFVLNREGCQPAEELCTCIENGDVDGFISPSIVHLIAYWMRKSHKTDEAKPFLNKPCNYIHVVNVGHEITINALKSDMKDVEDALQYYAALAHGMDLFISNDKKLKKLATPSLPVLKASEFLVTLHAFTPTTSTHSQ